MRILSVDDLETLNGQFFQRFSELIASILKEAIITGIDISEVILAGGSTRIPQIIRILDKLIISAFGHSVPILQMNEYTEEAHVAFGAALLAKQNIFVLNLIPFSLGFSKNDGGFKKLIEKDSYLPIKRSETTNDCNSVSIYLGDSLVANENDYLFKFNTNIVNKQKLCTILVSFDLDINGILEISFIDKTMEKKKKSEIEPKNKSVKKSSIGEPFETLIPLWFLFISLGSILIILYMKERRREEEINRARQENRRLEEINRARPEYFLNQIRQMLVQNFPFLKILVLYKLN